MLALQFKCISVAFILMGSGRNGNVLLLFFNDENIRPY